MTAALLDRPLTRQPAPRTGRGPAKPQLRVLNEAARRRRARHRTALLILFVAVLAGFFAVAFVHAELVAGQHDLDAVRAEISQAEARHAELARAVEEASAPAVIVERATALGMVRAEQPVYLVAAAPQRTIEIGRPLSAADRAVGQVAGPPADGADGATLDEAGLRGSLGVAGGISAAVRLAPTPAFALGASAETVGGPGDAIPSGHGSSTEAAEADRGAVGATATPVAGAATSKNGPTSDPASTGSISTSAPTPSSTPDPTGAGSEGGPVSTIAGSRAVTGPAATSGSVATTSDTPGAAGLASVAAATTSG